MCNLLNFPRLQCHPDFINWNVSIGRFDCFNLIKNILNDCKSFSVALNGDQISGQEKRRAPSGRLSKLLNDSVLYQYYVAKQTGTTTMFKFDPATQTSEVSILKDIVSGDTLTKFQKINLNEIKSMGFSYKGLKDGLFKSTGELLNK